MLFLVQENIATVPNVLSLGRIVLSPLIGYLVLVQNFKLAFGLFAVAGLSDVVSEGHLGGDRSGEVA